MKIGYSSYSLSRAIKAGDLDWLSLIRWVKENGGEHLEIVPFDLGLAEKEPLLKSIVQEAAEQGVLLSSYTIGADFLAEDEALYEAEIKRVLREVEVAAALGVTRMRHDAASRPVKETSVAQFERDLPRVVNACQVIADYAKQYGIVTSVENHGYHLQNSERVQRLVLAVDRENFRTTIDIGNFVCVDEDPIAAVKNNIGLASFVHFKDFYRRNPQSDPGEGWFRSKAGYHLRGAIVGHGDIDIPAVVTVVKESGYDGFVSVEFEGMEECRKGASIGLANLKRYFAA